MDQKSQESVLSKSPQSELVLLSFFDIENPKSESLDVSLTDHPPQINKTMTTDNDCACG